MKESQEKSSGSPKKSVLLFSGNPTQAQEIRKAVSPDYTVSVISSPSELYEHPGSHGVLLVDLEVTEQYASDPLIDYIKKLPVPVIVLAAVGDGRGIGEAMDRVGSNGYVIKTGDYDSILNSLIRRAIEQSSEKMRLHRIIIALKKRVDELEERLSNKEEEKPVQSVQDTKENILDEIIFVFKRGEIDLPSHPKMSQRFREMVDGGAGTQDIALLLKRDVAVSSKLISISNSTYYRGLTNNKTLEQALSRLGLNTAKQYVEVILNRALYTTKNKKLLSIMEMLWGHSLSCAYASQTITEEMKLTLPDDPFTLGLLHDIGKLVLLQTIGELQAKNKIGAMIDNAEIENTLETYHGQFGTSLLKLWKFPSGYLQIASYHDALEKADPISKELLVVHFANLLVKSMGYHLGGQVEIDLEGAESFRLLGLKPESVAGIRDRVKGHMEQSKEFFS
jgi:HD-like signal output (HDOD) protein